MVSELKAVISKIEKLKDDEQREIAKMLTEEMNWETTLQNSQEKLNSLAEEAIEEFKSGKTRQKGW